MYISVCMYKIIVGGGKEKKGVVVVAPGGFSDRCTQKK